MNSRERILTSIIALVAVIAAFLVLNNNNSVDNYLDNGLEQNLKRIAEETKKNSEKEIKRNRKRNKIGPLPKELEKKAVNSYSDFREFPYYDMEYTSDMVFEIIKDIYKEIDFYSEFEKGDVETYDFYKEKFKQLLTNKCMLYDKNKKQKVYFKDFSLQNVSADIHDLENNFFYFFDIDEDNAPELCISNNRTFVCTFDYVEDTDEMTFWDSLISSYDSLNGTKTVRWDWDGSRNMLIKLTADAEVEMVLSFYWKNDFNRKKNIEEMYYMVGLPLYLEKKEHDGISDAMKAEAYYDESTAIYYFRVTEDQFNELTRDYFIAAEQADENIKEVTFTYQEFFGDQ